jgi:hypothetical protein
MFEATNADRFPHPGYNPKLAPKSFLLFVGFLNEKCREIALVCDEDLISRVRLIFHEIPESILMSVDMIWIKGFR